MSRTTAWGMDELFRLKCPYCRPANIAAEGEYICRDCGTVLGPVFLPPIVELTPAKQTSHKVSLIHIPAPLRRAFEWYKEYMATLEQEGRRRVKRRYLDMVKMHLDKIAVVLGDRVATVALEIFQRLDKRAYQSKSPRVVAAALAYLATRRLGLYTHKRVIAEILNVSKFSIKDTAWRFKRHLQKEAD